MISYPFLLIKQTAFRIILFTMASVKDPTVDAIVLNKPAEDARVTITNEKIQHWWDHYKKNEAANISCEKEYCRPSPVKLRWKTVTDSKDDYDYYIYLSTDPDFENEHVFNSEDTSYNVYDLYRNTKYYWKVEAVSQHDTLVSSTHSFSTKDCARTIKVDGAYNTRDIGGYKTSSGKTVKQGMIYRSGNFDSIKEKGDKTIKELGIRTQLDLRKKGQGKVGKKTLPVRNYYHIRGHSYKSAWESDEYTEDTIKAMKLFADKENYPIVFHCIYGRDRTGTIAFMVNGLLGVSKEDLYRDYELTFLSKHSGTEAKKKMKKFSRFYRAMKKYKDPTQSLQYNIRAFLVDNGMTVREINNIEDIMLE